METVRAIQRLKVSERLRDDGLAAHTYPLREADEWTVERFYGAFGQLPPAGMLRTLWWWLTWRGA